MTASTRQRVPIDRPRKHHSLSDADFERLFAEESESVLAYFSRRVVDAQAALDLTAESFAQAVASRSRFTGSEYEEAPPWLFGIARNLLRHYYRRGKVEMKAAVHLKLERRIYERDDLREIEERLDFDGLRARAEAALSALPGDSRRAVELRILQGLDYPAVAKQIGESESTARKRVSRGLERMRETLESAGDER